MSSAGEKWDPTFTPALTPRKLGRLVLEPSFEPGAFDSHAVDCPFLFTHAGKTWMTYVGWDGRGYQTGLASSANLVDWQKEGILLPRGAPGSLTEHNMALTCLLRQNELYGPGELKQVDGRYVGVYHAYPNPGYEEGPAFIGLCFSRDLRAWEVGGPILLPADGAAWECGGLYKAWLLEENGVYYLFYNAKNHTTGAWREQTGLATSTDLLTWRRSPANPLLRNGGPGQPDEYFCSDPCVLFDRGQWYMFYFGLAADSHARDLLAVSDDLLHWTKMPAPLVDVSPAGPAVDTRHAHKAGIIARDGVLYHYYCAVADQTVQIGNQVHPEMRGISLAHS